MTRKFTFLMTAMALILAIMGPRSVAWGQTTQTWSYEVIQDSPTLFTGSPATVNGATWSIVMGEVVGSPTTNGVPTKYSGIFGWKWGDSGSKYYKSYTLSTEYFAYKNVKKVTVNFLNNGKKTGTMTVTQGSTTIGTASAEFGQTWTDLTANTTTGSGGTLSINYAVAQASYIHSIIVEYEEGTPSTDPTITCANITDVPYEGVTDAEANVTISNADDWTPSVTCDGSIVTAASLNNDNTKVIYSVSENEGDTEREGSFTITLSKDDEEPVSKVVSVTQNHFVVDYATLPFSYDGGKNNLPDGLTQNGLGSDYGSSPKMKFDDTGDYLILKINENPGTLSYKIKGNSFSGGTFKLQTSVDGETYTDKKTYTALGEATTETITDLDATVRYIKWIYTNKSSGNVALGGITLAKEVAKYTVSIAQGIENGSISVSPTSAIAGSTITITPNAAEGYILANYTICKFEDATDVTDIVNLNGNTFTMPNYDVTVSATFEEADKYAVNIAEGITHGEVVSVEDEYYEGATVQLMVSPATNYVLESFTITKTTGGTDTEIVPEYNEENGAYEFAMPAYNITVSATFEQVVTYTRVNDVANLIPGKHYLIIGEKNGTYYAMGGQNDNNRAAVAITATETTVQVPASSMHEFTISGDETNHYTFYELGLGYLYAAGANSDNYLKTETDLDEDDKGKWSVTFNENGEAIIISEAKNCSRNTMRFNASNNPPIFSCYSSGGQQPVYLYMKENDINNNIYSDTYIDGDISNCLLFSVNKGAALTVTGTIDENILMFSIVDGSQLIYDDDIPNGTIGNRFRKYDDNEAGQRTGWNLVSVPIKNYNVLPGISISGNYDLYSYDEPTHFWINEKGEPNPFLPLAIGTGYLFAMPSSNTHARFGGMGTLQGSGQDLSFLLSYTETLEGGEPNALKGFNLVGNPFTCNAYVDMDYLVLDATGSNFVNPNGPIKPGDAILVQATPADQEITFSRNEFTQQNNRIDVSVSQNRGSVIDNARIRFGEGRGMNKFYLNENSTRLYIPQNGKDYAVVMANAAEGEMPVNFKAEKNGSYTITVNTENIDAEYLHLIDNKTGMDTDLLSTPSYTFEAKTSDYASRFKLVFNVKNEEANSSSDNNFAFMSDGNLVISNIEGEATLQIVDQLGRVLSTETVSGSYNKALNLKAGLYILNLNGMTQKIVVK